MSSIADSGEARRQPQYLSVRWLWPYVRRELAPLSLVVLLAAGTSLLATAQPYLSKLIIDQGLIGRDFQLLVTLCLAMLGIALAGFALGALNRRQYVRVSGHILFALREDLYAHLLRLPQEFYRVRPLGDLITRLDGDVAEVQRFSTDTVLAIVNGVLLLTATVAIMLVMSVELTLVAAAVLPLQLLLRHGTRVLIQQSTRDVREQTGRLTHFLMETLGAAKAVQGAAAEDHEQQRLVALNEGLLARLLRQQLIGYSVGGAASLLSHVTTAAVFIVGGYRVVHGALTVGTLVAFVAYLTRSTASATSLMGLYTAYQRAAVSLSRLRELLDVEVALPWGAGSRRLEAGAAGRLKFDRVSFARAGQPPLFSKLSFEVPAGAKIVLCGNSGAGKSTLIDLLRGFAGPYRGRVLIDGIELREYQLRSLRRHIAVLETEPVLFRGTLLENIRYGNFDASEACVLEAARVAGVEEIAAALPHGYHTQLGSHGAGLSTGQRQRLAIARAMIGAPVLLVLDEATSNLDPGAVRAMHELLDRHFGARTRLVITHAPQLVPRADAILELRAGQLLELPRSSSVA